MSVFRVIGSLLCTATVLLTLTACGGKGNETTTAESTTSETTTVAEAVPLYLVGGEATYTIVRAEECSDTVKEVCTGLWNTCQKVFGKRIQIMSDWVRRGDSPPAMADEILIGLTNRAESVALDEEVEEGTYRIRVVDRRVVICASAEWMLATAVEDLVSRVEQDEQGRWYLPSDLDVVGNLAEYTRPGWALDGIPAYDGGELAAGTLHEPLHFTVYSAKSRLACLRRTTRDEFDRYLEKVKGMGFTVSLVTDEGGIYAARLEKGETRAYAYLSELRGEVRIVTEAGDDTPLEQFNYTYDKKQGETTTLVQFGLMMDKDGIDFSYNGNTRLNCGHMYFVKLADNSIVVIDGGGIQQMSDKTAAELMRLFRELTGTPAGEKVRIAGWFISHRHPDHYNGFVRFLNSYYSQVAVERIFYNITNNNEDIERIRNLLTRHYPDILYHKPHTGETIRLADVSFDVLHTLEDEVNSATGSISSSDFNDTSTVLRINFDGISTLLLGDAADNTQRVMLRTYEKSTLQCDILQVSHHGWNDLSGLYDSISPTIALYPQSSGGAQKGLSGNAATVLARIKKIADQLYFAGDETVGISVVGGVPTMTYRADVVGTDYSGWGF